MICINERGTYYSARDKCAFSVALQTENTPSGELQVSLLFHARTNVAIDPAISRSLIRLRFLGVIYTDIDDSLYLCSAFVDILIDNFPLRRKVEIITHGVQ